jgi:site-specific DNA-adenine methylase
LVNRKEEIMKILDCFSGNLSTWFDKNFAKNRVVKNDIRKGLTLEKQGQIIEIIADYNYNMFSENTIIDNGEFDLIYADPPHLINASGIMFKTYTDLNAYQLLSVEYDLINMLNNLNDNLSVNGVVIIKWNNKDFALKPLFKKSKLKLLFGTTNYKKVETYYYIAVKGI